jgi:putative transposase
MSSLVRYKGYRFPAEIIGFTVWSYFRFTVSFRDVEELLLKRGIVVRYKTVRSWVYKFEPF